MPDIFYSDWVGTKRLDLDYLPAWDFGTTSSSAGGPEGKQLLGQICIPGINYCQFGPISLPNHASRKDVKLKDGNLDVRIKFFGNGYIKLKVSREFIDQKLAPPPGAPKCSSSWEFGGIGRSSRGRGRKSLRPGKLRRHRRNPTLR